MKDFISTIREIPTDNFIHKLSEISIDMFNKNKYLYPLPYNIGYKTITLILSAWDINTMEYLSIYHSNDYRNSNKSTDLERIVNRYRIYENNHSISAELENADVNGVFRILLGMTSEQNIYQHPQKSLEKFNRNYHILFASNKISRDLPYKVDDIIYETFGYSVDDFISVLLIIFWLCMQHPDPLSAPETLYRKNDYTVLTKENLQRFIEYYSCDYDELKNSPLKKQLLYSKPFIKTKRHKKYLMANMYLVGMMLGDSLYWIIRDFYFQKNSQDFVNKFGYMFEDYLKELATIYFSEDKWEIIPLNSQKSADFIFHFDDVTMIIEQKSALMSLNGKQQVPNTEFINKFFEQTIKKAYKQLEQTCASLPKNKPVLKIILLYENLPHLGLAESSIIEIFQKDSMCFIITIAELEILFYLWKNDKIKCQSVFEKMLTLTNNDNELLKHSNLTKIFTEMHLHQYSHFENDLDYFQNAMNNLASQLGLN